MCNTKKLKMVRKVQTCSKPSARGENSRILKNKLKRIGLEAFNRVCTFSKGAFGEVSLVQLAGHPDSAFAMKAMKKSQIKSPSDRELAMSEKKILDKMNSDFIIKLYRTFKDKKYLYLLTEYCCGGNLSGRGPMPEKQARFYTACVVEALECLHSKHVVHNDLKPLNLVMDSAGYVKVIDMGIATEMNWGEVAYNGDGTTEYLPPEATETEEEEYKGRDRAVDLWALGVILYEFIRGRSPFEDVYGCKNQTRKNILNGIDGVQFSRRYFSAEAADLIRRLCAYEPKDRLGYRAVDEIRKHRWFKNFDWESLRSKKLKPPLIPQLRSLVDTQNFGEAVTPDSDVEDDESDWDKDF